MKEKKDVRPDVITYGSLMYICDRSNNWQLALDLDKVSIHGLGLRCIALSYYPS